MSNKYLILSFLFFILLTFFSLHIPFFWDGTFFSELAVDFYENGFQGFIALPQADTGGFPLYSFYLMTIWELFGKTLAISHIAFLPFLLGIAFEYFKLAKRFLNASLLPFALLLLIFEPAYITQGILMGYDILLIYFFFLTLNALLSGKQMLYRIALVLLCICSMRGIMLGISLLLLDVFIHYEVRKKININYRNYVGVFFIVFLWAFYHHAQTGWFFFSPVRENTHEAFLPISMMFRQFVFIAWKVADFGRITLWLFLVISGIYFYRKTDFKELKTILAIVFIPLFVLAFFMIPLANPIGHKYFIVIFLSLNIGVCYLVQQLKSKKLQILFCAIFCVSLVSGNFWIYLERYGNGWDSSLKVLPYFQLKKQMDDYIRENNIAPNEIGTQFPMIADKRFSELSDTSYFYSNVWGGPINNYSYFLYSNVINTDIPEKFEEVKRNWAKLKEYKSGQVIISLYKNKIK